MLAGQSARQSCSRLSWVFVEASPQRGLNKLRPSRFDNQKYWFAGSVRDDRTERHSASNVWEMGPAQLTFHARRLARDAAPGGDRYKAKQDWNAVAFQVQGLVDQLSAKESYELLRAFSTANILDEYGSVQTSLLGVLRKRGEFVLKPRKVVSVWTALDRADAELSHEDQLFLKAEVTRTSSTSPLSTESETRASLRGRDWRRMLAQLVISDCTLAELTQAWLRIETAAVADKSALKALSITGLVSALRAAAAARDQAVAEPNPILVNFLQDQVVAQARLLDGWQASHIVFSNSFFGFPPARAYDPFRSALLRRCSLSPAATDVSGPSARLGESGLRGLAATERVITALSRLGVYDSEVRNRAAKWLAVPMPPPRLASLVQSLTNIGLTEAANLARVAAPGGRKNAK